MNYTGRFAPSPTGPLHFGSLVAALASFCDAHAADGKWLLRMEDIDTPREMPGAADLILRQLEAYGLEWDGEVLFQHTRHEAYREALQELQSRGEIFWCRCSRAELTRGNNSLYPGNCRHFLSPRDDAAVRVRVPAGRATFTDRIFGPQTETVEEIVGDFVIQRRDGLFAYQLAVVVDDAMQGITDVVRGADLLSNTARQIVLQGLLKLETPRYMHLPLVLHADGSKLSKQTFAPAIPLPADGSLLWQALDFLHQQPPVALKQEPLHEIVRWGVENWQPGKIQPTNF